MIHFLKNYGLDKVLKDEDVECGFIAEEILEKAKHIPGYKDIEYIYKSMGDVEFWAKFVEDEPHKKSVIDIDAHSAGPCLWNLRRSSINFEDFNTDADEHIMFQGMDDEQGILPIYVINSAVHPGLLEGDTAQLQVVGHPFSISYYEDEKSYEKIYEKDENGERFILGVGTLLPVCFFNNHAIDPKNPDEEKKENNETDFLVTFTGKVDKVYHGILELGEKRYHQFIQCFFDTNFGQFEVVHSIDQIDESERDNIKPGAIIHGVCMISGDIAILDYADGIIKDLEHNLMLLRYVIAKGDPGRMSCVLTDDVVYETDSYGTSYNGKDEVIARFDEVNSSRTTPYFVHMATITKIDNKNLEYDVDTRCLVLASDDINNFESILFIELNSEGLISKIKVSTDSNYHFKIDKPDYLKDDKKENENDTN